MFSALQPLCALSLRTALPGLFEFILVTVVAFAVIGLVVSHMRFERLTLLASEAELEAMSPAEAFVVRIADRLGRPPRERCDFAVLLMAFAPNQELPLKQITPYLRAGDLVLTYDEGVMGLLVDTPRHGAKAATDRLASAVPELRPSAVGLATNPECGSTAQGLADAAAQALREAQATEPDVHIVLAEPQTTAEAPDVARQETGPHLLIAPHDIPTALQRFVARRRKETLAVAVVFTGIDHFDRYEKQYGDEGSEHLALEVADLLLRNIRRGDLVGRHERQTFVLALECGCRQAVTAAERLAPIVRKAVFHVGASGLKASISSGVAAYPEHGGLPRALFDGARLAQYTAEQKREGCRVYHRSMRRATLAGQPKDVL